MRRASSRSTPTCRGRWRLNLEMETSALFTLAAIGGLRAGAVCVVYAERPTGRVIRARDRAQAEARAIAVGLEAFERLG